MNHETVAVVPNMSRALMTALRAAERDHHWVKRVVFVGLDPILNAKSSDDTGFQATFTELLNCLRSLENEPVQVVWRTRAGINQLPQLKASRPVFQALAPRLAFEIGLPSLDPEHCEMLEGRGVEHPNERLRLAEILSAWEVPVRVRIDPLLPMLTDQRNSLDQFFETLVRVGIARVAVRYLVLTAERAHAIMPRLNRLHREMLKACFAESPWQQPAKGLSVYDGAQPFKRLPDHMRESGHQRVLHAASRVGIAVDIMDPVGSSSGVQVKSNRHRRPSKWREREKRMKARSNAQMDLFVAGRR
ncbi:MAG: hypothetical protein CMH56_01435 [Myxococcales bacterium]|nr:hypothetical protein [Myxococcales bacterium]